MRYSPRYNLAERITWWGFRSISTCFQPDQQMAHRRELLFMLLYMLVLPVVSGNFTLPSRLSSSDIVCMDECYFFSDNQTITIVNVTEPKKAVLGVAYYTTPVRMKDPATRTVASFHTSFTFREEPQNFNASPYVTLDQMESWLVGDGFTFMLTNSSSWKGGAAGRLGIFASDPRNNPKVVAVEFDSFKNDDTDYNLEKQAEHVGLDVRTPISDCYAYIQQYNISFYQRRELQTWIEYDGNSKVLELRISNTSSRPESPLLNCSYDLYEAVDERMYIGFSGAVGDAWSVYYISNWTFTSYGISNEFGHGGSRLAIILGVTAGIAIVLFFSVLFFLWKRRRDRDESRAKDGMVEIAGMPEFISYKHLSAATNQFKDESKLGTGGFGSVYRGVLPKTGELVAVKKVSSDSRQGEREFLAEVQIISQLRHRNIVELKGFCRDRGKFLLVYELMPRGSLDQALFQPKTQAGILPWNLRWKIVSGTAASLHYLHEGWRQQIIHRDVKSSNIMLDDECNPKLGDFGLARLVDHEKHAATTMVAGTYGYLAPEAVGGKFTDKTDVFAFGAVAMEVACGRLSCDRAVENVDDLILVDLVRRRLKEGELLSAADARLGGDFNPEQMQIVLKLGLLCSQSDPSSRPSMRQVVQVLAGEATVPDAPEASDMSHFSIDDLLNGSASSRSSRGGLKRFESPFSLISSPSVGHSSLNSFGMQTYPR